MMLNGNNHLPSNGKTTNSSKATKKRNPPATIGKTVSYALQERPVFVLCINYCCSASCTVASRNRSLNIRRSVFTWDYL